MPQQLQTKSNHTRIDPSFHFFFLPLTVFLLIWTLIHLARHPGTSATVLAVTVFLVGFMGLKARMYAAKVQDRVIRLEERLRLAGLLPDRLRPRIQEIGESQLIALRFAPDAELPALAERVLNERLTNKQIKEAIQTWRGDYWRV